MTLLDLTIIDYEFTDYLIKWGYWGIFLWFLTIDNFSPVPQEISLLLIGYMSAHQVFNPFLAAMISLFSFIIIDIIYFRLSQKGNRFIIKIYRRNVWAEQYANKLENHMGPTLFTLCFIPRMRFISPILVGILNLSFRKFLFYDVISIAVFAFTYVFIGRVFYRSLDEWITQLNDATLKIFLVALLVIITFIIGKFIYSKREKSTKMPASHPTAPEVNEIPEA